MTKRIAALALAGIALIAGPAFAMGEGGCNWSAYFQSAASDIDAPDVVQPAPADEARG